MEQQKQLHLTMEWDLQWFAKDGPGGEKTEPATAKKLREAREDGKVVKSKELTAAFDLIILLCLTILVAKLAKILKIWRICRDDLLSTPYSLI